MTDDKRENLTTKSNSFFDKKPLGPSHITPGTEMDDAIQAMTQKPAPKTDAPVQTPGTKGSAHITPGTEMNKAIQAMTQKPDPKTDAPTPLPQSAINTLKNL